MTPATDGRWVPLLALSTTVAVSFGVLLYSVSVLITEEAAGSVFSTTVLSAGYGGALLVGGLLAPSVGRRADRLGVRLIFVTGIVLGASGVTMLSVANSPWHVLAAFWLLIGPSSSWLPAWLLNSLFRGAGFASVLAVHAYSFCVFFYAMTYAALQRRDPSLVEAARTLGASRSRIFFRVTAPALAPSLGGAEPGRALMTYWALCGKGMVGIEYLTNVGQVPQGAYFLFAAVKIRGCHGGPGRAIVLH